MFFSIYCYTEMGKIISVGDFENQNQSELVILKIKISLNG